MQRESVFSFRSEHTRQKILQILRNLKVLSAADFPELVKLAILEHLESLAGLRGEFEGGMAKDEDVEDDGKGPRVKVGVLGGFSFEVLWGDIAGCSYFSDS